jgi:hypothetical protein
MVDSIDYRWQTLTNDAWQTESQWSEATHDRNEDAEAEKTFDGTVASMRAGGDLRAYRLQKLEPDSGVWTVLKTVPSITKTGEAAGCGEGMHYDEEKGECVKDTKTCDEGFHWDDTTKTCVVDDKTGFDWAANWFWVVGAIIVIILIIMYWYFKVYDGGV